MDDLFGKLVDICTSTLASPNVVFQTKGLPRTNKEESQELEGFLGMFFPDTELFLFDSSTQSLLRIVDTTKIAPRNIEFYLVSTRYGLPNSLKYFL